MKHSDVKKVIDIVRDMFSRCNCGYGMSVATMRSYLEPLTKALKCQNDKDWQQLCFDWNNNKAQEYLQLSPKELINFNGMAIKNWPEDKITRKDILTAIDAREHALTPATILSQKKLRKHLKNIDYVNLAKKNPMYIHDYNNQTYTLPNLLWLKCLDKNDHSLAKLKGLKSFEDWLQYIDIAYYLLDRTLDTSECVNILTKLGAPSNVINYASELYEFKRRYEVVNPYLDWGKKIAVPLSSDPQESAEFETYLKMINAHYNDEWNSNLRYDQHYQDAIFGLRQCLIAKYNKQQKEITL